MRYLSLSFCFLALLATITSCYRMPDDDCISTIPITNNPQVVPQRGGNMMMPNANF